jgi:hypothetical protein
MASRGAGDVLLAWVVGRGAEAARIIGARALVTAAPDQRDRPFFEDNGFEPLPGDPFRLYVPLRDGRRDPRF